MKMLTRTALAAALLAAAPLASAATDDDTMTVSITIENSCTITAGDLSFGTANSLSGNIDGQTTVSLLCTNAGPVSIAFDDGTGASATYASRKMSGIDTDNAGATINYSLFRDGARSEVLGDGAGSTVQISTTSTGGPTAQSFDVFGRVFGGQGAKPVGDYTDSVVATVSF